MFKQMPEIMDSTKLTFIYIYNFLLEPFPMAVSVCWLVGCLGFMAYQPFEGYFMTNPFLFK